MQHVQGELQSGVQQMLRLHSFCGCGGALPIDARLRRDQARDVRDPAQPFPKMLGAVDTDKHKLIFHAGSGHFASIEADTNLACEELLNRKWPRKITKGQIIVEFDQKSQT